MSASLVGSEMCIRDRPRARLATRWQTPPTIARWAPIARAFHWSPAEGGCLLYTSDAADDM
eukprot:12276635-Alexandrium_andersonii.AAC.1